MAIGFNVNDILNDFTIESLSDEFMNYAIEERGADNLVAVFARRFPRRQLNLEGGLDNTMPKEVCKLITEEAYNEESLCRRIERLKKDDSGHFLETLALGDLRARKNELGLG